MESARSLPSYQPGGRGKGKGASACVHAKTTWKNRAKHTVALHDGEELDNDLGGRADQDLALAGLLGVVDRIQAVVENRSLDHVGGCRFSMAVGRLRYLRAKGVVSLQMPEHGECPQCCSVRVLQLVSQRRSSVAIILADSGECFSRLSEGHSGAMKTYLVGVGVASDRFGRERAKSPTHGSRICFTGPWARLVTRWILACIHPFCTPHATRHTPHATSHHSTSWIVGKD